MGRAFGALLLLLAIAYGGRLIWDLLSPMVPALTAVVLVVVLDIAWPQSARDRAASAIAHSICSQQQPGVCSQP